MRTVLTIRAGLFALATAALAVGRVQGQQSQDPRPFAVWGEVFVNSELERYLRLLQVTGDAPLYPWSVRGFSPREVDRLWPPSGGHPWAARYDLTSGSGKLRFGLIRPSLSTSYNTTFPYGSNDGPVWAGKGLTTAIQGGFAARYGPVSLTVAPTTFRAENTDFELMPNGQTGVLVYADGRYPRNIDRPQRFGDEPHQRFDPGQSTLRVDLPVVALGVSTANQHWGPAIEYPIILGNNAAGFPHAFLGTSEPLDLWLFTAHGRLVWGDLRQSRFSSAPDSASRRFMSGVVGVLTPRGVPGLELGAARFFHTPWPIGGLRFGNFTKPLESILKVGLPDTTAVPGQPRTDLDNQLASVFARWVFPDPAFEVYFEYGREDHNWDLRDLALEPDHSSGYVVGLRKVWAHSDTWMALRTELSDLQASHLERSRSQGRYYTHTFTRQGHTHLGQVLGTAAGVGGLASMLALERYDNRGRWMISWQRELRQTSGTFLQTGIRDSNAFDVMHTLGAEAVFFRGSLDITAGINASYNFNRNLDRDRLNVGAHLSITSAIPWIAKPVSPTPAQAPVRNASQPDSDRESLNPRPYLIGSEEEDRQRVDQLLGARPTDGFLVRALSHQWEPKQSEAGSAFTLIPATVHAVWNSGVPLSLNDGALWAGRGVNTRVLAGVRAAHGHISLVLAPQLLYSQNLDFEPPDPRLAPAIPADRSAFASPWYSGSRSLDQPLRFGSGDLSRLDPGQSTLTVTSGSWAIGVSTEDQWWGPGVRNAIVLSNNAPGFPHLFLRTARPLRTRVGTFEAKWLAGGLSESEYFDADPDNDLRSLSALALTWTPTFEKGLTLGVARAVYAPASGWDDVLARWPNAVFTDPGRPADRPPGDTTMIPGPDQVYSLFGRWVFLNDGFEVYGEWSRTELPASFRDLLVAPNHTKGFTVGFQWAKPLTRTTDKGQRTTVIRLQGEMTYLEESPTFRDRPLNSYYTSRAVIQGYTHRGQVIGAAVGPGGSGQWLAMDYLAPRWRVGLFAERIRWNNDVLYTLPEGSPGNHFCMHDVSLSAGLKAGLSAPFGEVTASVSTGTRMNIHFQNFTYCSNPDGTDRTYIPNHRLELVFTRPW